MAASLVQFSTPPLLFVGERRSPTAIRMGVTWKDGRVCAKTLHDALRLVGIDPETCRFMNAFDDDGSPDLLTVVSARVHVNHGGVVIGLGLKAQQALDAVGIPHLKAIHPAARGSIRRTEAYQAHLRQVLTGGQI